ncbi:MAG TPA: LysR substrate-binding domain-containing protein, partial [Reyranella sp.]|nr:LysR substrate-binding domain-containing protein [Reyranella sp.]
AVHGQGLAFAPLPLVLPLFRAGALVPLLVDWMSEPADLFLHYPNRRHLPVRVRSFVQFMLERLRKNPDLSSDPRALVAPFLQAPARRGRSASRHTPAWPGATLTPQSSRLTLKGP